MRKRQRKKFNPRQSNNNWRSNKSHIQCHSCKKYGHIKAECWFRDKNVNFAEESEVSDLFMVHYNIDEVANSVCLVDSGCSNHMTGVKELFH